MAESEEETKSLLMKVKQENEKVGLKFNIQKTKIMTSGLITSWQIEGETVETVADFILGGSKVIADGDCSHEIKRRLLPERKVMTERLLLKEKTPEFLASGGEFNPGPETRLDRSELLCNKVLLKYPAIRPIVECKVAMSPGREGIAWRVKWQTQDFWSQQK